jgi:hypothetical protein
MSEENIEGLEASETLEATEATEAPADAAPSEPVGSAKPHPAHEKLLAELPEAWHQKVLPHLQEQDKYFQQEIERYSPYKQFVEDGVDPAYINQSMQLAQAISRDPVTVHKNLTSALMQQGLIREEAEKAADEIIEETEGIYGDDELPESVKRELQRRDVELDQIKQQMSQQEFEKATEYELQNINKEFESLTASYEVSPAQERAILELMDAAAARGTDLSVVQAAKKLVEITGSGFKKKGSGDSLAPPAPTVLGGSGGNGVPFENVEIPQDSKAKKEMLAQMFKNNMA